MGISMFVVLIVAIIALVVGICSSIASYVWLIYSLIAIAIIGFNIYLFVTKDYEKWEFAIGSALGLGVGALIADLIVSIGT